MREQVVELVRGYLNRYKACNNADDLDLGLIQAIVVLRDIFKITRREVPGIEKYWSPRWSNQSRQKI